MRMLMLVASLAAVVALAMTTEAAPRADRHTGATGGVDVTKDTSATTRARAVRFAIDRQEAARYRGLQVEASADAESQERAIQEQIAQQLSWLDFVPTHRVDHFRWIPEQLGLPILGWRGRIVTTSQAADGVRVTVQVAPIAGIGTADHTRETYLISDGHLVHLASEGAPSRGVTTFP